MFQSTFPQGERQRLGVCFLRKCSFNPRSRKGNDDICYSVLGICLCVSIHVPARGTTVVIGYSSASMKVSIHVPARGTTELIEPLATITTFQSTFPQGERLSTSTVPRVSKCFNPRSRKGNDDADPLKQRIRTACFNPRSRKGNDFM